MTLCLVENEKSLAAIIIPVDANSSVQNSAHLLSRYILLSTRAKIPVERENVTLAPDIIKLHLGYTAYVNALHLGIEKIDADGFIIAFPDARNVVICGASEWGTEFAVYEFLERYLGIRWLFPGDLGEYIPEHKTLRIPADEVRQEPAFFSRSFSGLGAQGETWARRNRMHNRVKFSENLLWLFPPEKYTKTHPEFFPIISGERYLPARNNVHGWQPCFFAEGIVEEAINNICEYFANHPEATSYSLGVNDLGGHCECEKCLARVPGKKNILGMKNYSDIYYEWCNAVVEGVLKQYPDKYFGLLAYSEAFEPPANVKLNSHIIPYMTYERLKWADKEIEEEGHKLTKEWTKAVSTLGWYDYIYGRPCKNYLVPRVWFHKMADYYRFGYEHQVRYLYAEAYPAEDWREGPKLYLSLKLQWNPYLDVDETLMEWYKCAVGKDAAPYLSNYFAFWEKFWTERILQSIWFKDARKIQFLNFGSNSYLNMLTGKDINECEELLRLVVAKAKGEKEKLRADFFLSSFKTWGKTVTRNLNDFEQVKRLGNLTSLEGSSLLFGVTTYKNFLDKSPGGSLTDSLYLQTGLLMEKAGKKGAWAQSFDNSPWGKSTVIWLKPFVCGLQPSDIGKKTLSIIPTSVPPRIDGILNDKCWKEAEKVDNFREYRSDTIVSQPTLVAGTYDANNLYLAYLCLETDTDKLVTEFQEHDSPAVWEDDCVEFFVIPAAEGDNFYHMIVSAAGIKYDAHYASNNPTGWNPEYSAKVYTGDLFWTVEMALPLASFTDTEQKPIQGSQWKVNFNRARREKKQKDEEISGWTFTAGNNWSPDKFGILLFR
ncbi:MAG: DUF4838 domain-containing protein [Candidatus Omnitrophota bacterium]